MKELWLRLRLTCGTREQQLHVLMNVCFLCGGVSRSVRCDQSGGFILPRGDGRRFIPEREDSQEERKEGRNVVISECPSLPPKKYKMSGC
ncbi:hypothetical protein NQZ68_007579 [Dissostichus eleginoides]|nr:hypothetical protein NQZ68_007579 [Dissostichus eleginoides]